MPRQCQFPVQCSDNRRCYRSGTPGFVIGVALLAAFAGYASLSEAAVPDKAAVTRTNSAVNSSRRVVDFKLPSDVNASSAFGTLS